MTANRFSSYETFSQIIDFSAHVQRVVPLLVKIQFVLILKELRTEFKMIMLFEIIFTYASLMCFGIRADSEHHMF